MGYTAYKHVHLGNFSVQFIPFPWHILAEHAKEFRMPIHPTGTGAGVLRVTRLSGTHVLVHVPGRPRGAGARRDATRTN